MRPTRLNRLDESAEDSSIQVLRHELSAVRAALRDVHYKLEEANSKIDILRKDLRKQEDTSLVFNCTAPPESNLTDGCDMVGISKRILDQLRSDVVRIVHVEAKRLRAENRGAEQHLEMLIKRIEQTNIQPYGVSFSHKYLCGNGCPIHPLEEDDEVDNDMRSHSTMCDQLLSDKVRLEALEHTVGVLKGSVSRLFCASSVRQPQNVKNVQVIQA